MCLQFGKTRNQLFMLSRQHWKKEKCTFFIVPKRKAVGKDKKIIMSICIAAFSSETRFLTTFLKMVVLQLIFTF